jgi:predicted 3-demethylubiquinone-9 3-methyltransferase (glyoxalase superfamily)
MTTTITPFLWFDHQAEEAANFYVSVFPNSKITAVVRYGEAGPGTAGSAMTVAFELDGKEFTALNGGPHYKFSPAISFVVHCKNQQEVDHYWDSLSAGGTPNRCGWLDDKFGVTWQIVPDALLELLQSDDAARAGRVTRAMMGMVKIEIDGLERAAAES